MTLEKPSKEFYEEFKPTEKDILILKEWIAKMPHILQDYDDYFLAALIRSKKGSIQNTKILLENFNSLGYRYPKVLGRLDPLNDLTQNFLNAMYCAPLPKRVEDGSLVCMIAPINDPNIDLSNFDWYGLQSFWIMSILVIAWEKMEGSTKAILVYDCTNEKLAKLKGITPTLVRDNLQVLIKCPIRIQAVYFVNVPPFVESIINFGKTFIKNKVVQRIQFPSSLESLFEKVPRKLFPKEYGGDEASIAILNDAWRTKVASYRDELIKTSDKMRKLDHLRPKLEEHDQELEGTFRQLHID